MSDNLTQSWAINECQYTPSKIRWYIHIFCFLYNFSAASYCYCMWRPCGTYFGEEEGRSHRRRGETCRYRKIPNRSQRLSRRSAVKFRDITQSDGEIKGGRELLIQLQNKELVCCWCCNKSVIFCLVHPHSPLLSALRWLDGCCAPRTGVISTLFLTSSTLQT